MDKKRASWELIKKIIQHSGSAYEIGSILVYLYKSEGILTHRLLQIENKRYYCKGDSSFRLEDIDYESILGKIVKVIRNNNIISLLCGQTL